MFGKLFQSVRRLIKGPDAAAVIGIVIFFLVTLPRALFHGRYAIGDDALAYSYPLRSVAWNMIRHGEWPLWTPYLFSGYPLHSMAQIGLGYPLTWGYLFLPGYVAEQVYLLAPFILGPLFTYAYLRQLQRSPLASLLGSLTFAYGGMMASQLASNGLMQNAVIWLPLFLIALERARKAFLPSVLMGTGAFTLSVLTGVGQAFLYAGLLAVLYAIFLSIATRPDNDNKIRSTVLQLRRRMQPLLVALISILLAMGVAAFQVLATWRVVSESVRNSLTYDLFTEGSFTPASLWKSIVAPLLYGFDMTAYVLPFALALGCVAVYFHARGPNRDVRVLFWLFVAIAALALMLGKHSPIYQLVYHTPLLNRFRVPSRHTFEWTFAVGVLAAYGWDSVADRVRGRRVSLRRAGTIALYVAIMFLALSAVVGAVWWLKIQTINLVASPGALRPTTVYRIWKGAFVLLTLGAFASACLIVNQRHRFFVLLAAILLVCYIEPSAVLTRWMVNHDSPASRFSNPSEATKYLQQFPPAENRVYTRVDLFSEQREDKPRLDPQNLSAIYGLHNVAGYEPLVLERYSQALGGAGLDALTSVINKAHDHTLLTSRSHVLDILNTTFVVSYSDLATSPVQTTYMYLPGEIEPHATKTLASPPVEGDSLELSVAFPTPSKKSSGDLLARLRVRAMDDTSLEYELHATNENDQSAGRISTFTFGKPVNVRQIDITNVTEDVRLAIRNGVLHNSRTRARVPLLTFHSDAWQPVYTRDDVLILRNNRAQPRVWLVAEAASVTSDEALARIRGESETNFDPRRTALLEAPLNELPQLPGGEVSSQHVAGIVSYESNRIVFEASAPGQSILMVSEIYYPGWVATIDGTPARIYVADYLLRGVALPAGTHRVEMQYRPATARTGIIISALTLPLMGALAATAIFRRRKVDRSPQ